METRFTPRIIRNKEEHQAALDRLDYLMRCDPAKWTKAGDELELIALLIADYESKSRRQRDREEREHDFGRMKNAIREIESELRYQCKRIANLEARLMGQGQPWPGLGGTLGSAGSKNAERIKVDMRPIGTAPESNACF